MNSSDISDDDWLLDLLTCHRPAPWLKQSKGSEKVYTSDVCSLYCPNILFIFQIANLRHLLGHMLGSAHRRPTIPENWQQTNMYIMIPMSREYPFPNKT